MSELLDDTEKYVSLVTYRRDGRPVATPVWFAAMGDEFGVITETNVGKVKRIRNNPMVSIRICDMSGNVAPLAPTLTATARLVTGHEAVAVRRAVARKYGFVYVMFNVYWSASTLLARLRGHNKHEPETGIVFRINP